jgi:hypothetical protein
MKTWFVIGAVALYLIVRRVRARPLYVSRGGTSYYQTDEFTKDAAVSADVSATATGPTTLTNEEIQGKEISWTL